MISKEINVLDDAMRDAIVHFIKEENASKIPQIRENIVKQELLPLFSNTKLHDIDKDYILNLIETQSISAVTQRFLLYLCQNNYLSPQNDLHIIKAFKQILIQTYRKNYLQDILASGITEEFIKLHPHIQKSEYTVFFLSITEIDFEDTNLKMCADKYINYIKLDNKMTIFDKQAKLCIFKSICKNFISKIQAHELTRETVIYYLSMDWTRMNTINVFSSFIVYMESLNQLYDKELYIVSTFKKEL